MRSVILDGSRETGTGLDLVHDVLVEILEGDGWQVDTFLMRGMDLTNCHGCSGCSAQNPAACNAGGDAYEETAALVLESDLLVFLTPVTFGGYTLEFKHALARLIPHVLGAAPDMDGPYLDARYPALLGIGTLQDPVEDSIRFFESLVARHAVLLLSSAHAAGVIVGDPDMAQVRREITALLDTVGVR